jgi:hypothetical protein
MCLLNAGSKKWRVQVQRKCFDYYENEHWAGYAAQLAINDVFGDLGCLDGEITNLMALLCIPRRDRYLKVDIMTPKEENT